MLCVAVNKMCLGAMQHILFLFLVYVSIWLCRTVLHLVNNCDVFSVQAQGMRRHVEEIVFSFTYPRLDSEVFVLPDFLLRLLTRFSAPFIIKSICSCI